MKKLFYIFTLLTFLGFAFSGCKKDKDPGPTTGSLKAMVSPADGATSMRATLGNNTFETTATSTGEFLLESLAAGTYSVTFNVAPGYQAPATRTVEVKAGNQTDLGTITLQKIINTGSFAASVSGSGWSAPVPYASVDTGTIVITGVKASFNGSSETIALVLVGVTSTGTFHSPQANATYSQTSFTATVPPMVLTKAWDSSQGICTVTITKLDLVKKVVSGTFNFTANPSILVQNNMATGTKTITGGVFSDVAFQ